MRRRLSSQKGASMVEFALVLPILLLILLGMIEFGIILYNQQVITNASREGCRAGIVSQNPRVGYAEIQKVVTDYCAAHVLVSLGAGGGIQSIVTTPADPAGANLPFGGGNALTVRVTYLYQFLAFHSIANMFFGGTYVDGLPLHAETVMRYE